jgi:antitoxin FitA
MPKTVQIRDLDDEVYAGLARPTVEEWLKRTRRRSSSVDRADIVAALDEMRGPWPDAGG